MCVFVCVCVRACVYLIVFVWLVAGEQLQEHVMMERRVRRRKRRVTSR